MAPLNEQLQPVSHFDTLVDHYVLYNVIGHGCAGTAKVNITQHIPTEKLLAVKRLKLDHCQYDLSLIQVTIIIIIMLIIIILLHVMVYITGLYFLLDSFLLGSA